MRESDVKVLGTFIGATIAFFIITPIFGAAFGFWLEWGLESVLHKDVNIWGCIAGCILWVFFAPQKIKYYLFAALILLTMYVWIF